MEELEGQGIVKKPRGKRVGFTGPELLQLASATVDVNPWSAGYGGKTKAWEEIASRVRSNNNKFCKLNRLTNMYKRKMEALLAWHKDGPDSSGGVIEKEIIDRKDVRISIAALLDKAGHMRKVAAEQTEENREKAQMIQEENKEGGDSIRSNAMGTMKHSRPSSDEFEKENVSPDGSGPKVKCLRHSGSTAAGRLGDIKSLMEEDIDQHHQQHEATQQETVAFHSKLLDLFEQKL
ncbi:hypothetical protein M422DRAFT_53718 [Sphaerobolus stellatus SS14]|uniref:Myb/SANT-like DNA-binding domain-containing protein n=1 Tax=Sphaerobolus stellatus (strain SS14) TaxID=990650 RepID=A0A0C9UYQ0_SPHS4|nr:hypothetical protein M422DRAFT_53718 [Sphaerobolus stellatus SS14]